MDQVVFCFIVKHCLAPHVSPMLRSCRRNDPPGIPSLRLRQRPAVAGPSGRMIDRRFSDLTGWLVTWLLVKTLAPSEPQNSWQMDVHPIRI